MSLRELVGSLKPQDVVPCLRENLAWKVAWFDGQEKDVAEVPGLQVSVAATEVRIGDDGFANLLGPVCGAPERHTG